MFARQRVRAHEVQLCGGLHHSTGSGVDACIHAVPITTCDQSPHARRTHDILPREVWIVRVVSVRTGGVFGDEVLDRQLCNVGTALGSSNCRWKNGAQTTDGSKRYTRARDSQDKLLRRKHVSYGCFVLTKLYRKPVDSPARDSHSCARVVPLASRRSDAFEYDHYHAVGGAVRLAREAATRVHFA
jgi:hypothetical protein